MAFEGQRWGLTYSKFHKTVMAFGMLKCVKFCEMDPGMIMNNGLLQAPGRTCMYLGGQGVGRCPWGGV